MIEHQKLLKWMASEPHFDEKKLQESLGREIEDDDQLMDFF